MLPLACLSRSRTICCYCAVVGLCVFRVWVDVCLCLMCVGIWSCDREEGADERSASFWSFEVRNRERDKGREGEREGESERRLVFAHVESEFQVPTRFSGSTWNVCVSTSVCMYILGYMP